MAHRKVQPGQKLKQSPIHHARYINDTVDVVNAWKEGRVGASARPASARRSTNQVEIKNLTGSDRQLGDVVELGGHLLTDVTQDYPWLEGNTFAGTKRRKFAILAEAIPAGTIDTAQTDGVCIARVNVTDTNHTHAIPVAGYYTLSSAPIGPVEFLLPPTATGEQLLWVRIDQSENFCYAAMLDASVDDGDTASVTLSDGRTESAVNRSGVTLAAGNAVVIQDLVTGEYMLVGGGTSEGTPAIDPGAIVRVNAATANPSTCLWSGKVVAVSGMPSGACTNPFAIAADCHLLVLNSNGGSWDAAEDKVTLAVGDHYIGRYVFDVGGLPVYAIRHTPKPATVLYKGTLAGTLLHASATCSVDNLQSYSELPAPSGAITANNIRKFAGTTGDTCVVIENNSVTPPTYDLLAVQWDELERVTDLTYSAPTLTEHKRKFLGKNTNSETTENTALFSPTLQSLVTDVSYNAATHTLQKTVRVTSVLSVGSPTTSTVLTASATTWLSDLTFDTELGLDATVKTGYILGEITATNTVEVADMHTVSAIGDVDFDGDDLNETPVTLKFLGTSTAGSAANILETFEVLVMIDSLVNAGMTELQKTTRIVRVVGVPSGSTTSKVADIDDCG
jgi:hypothetical protein